MAKKSIIPSPSHLKPQKPLINTSAKETLEKLSEPGKKPGKKNLPKRILFWNDFYGSRNYGFCCGRNPFRKAKCPVWNCQVNRFVQNIIFIRLIRLFFAKLLFLYYCIHSSRTKHCLNPAKNIISWFYLVLQ